MKRKVLFAIGACIFATASAISNSEQNSSAAQSADQSDFGQVAVENLTEAQRAVLRAKYQYWTSSTYIAPKAPI